MPVSAFPAPPRLVLGSSSPYRRELLARLGQPFETRSPDVDETPLAGEAPMALACRLAEAKAREVASGFDEDVIVIGSDQVADLDGQALGKPGQHAAARDQLRALSGRVARFHTAVCVMRPKTGQLMQALSSVTVQFRALSEEAIETYLLREQPYDCAGSAKCEGLGIVLLERIDSDDPTALVGLPLIATSRLLREAGWDPLTASPSAGQHNHG